MAVTYKKLFHLLIDKDMTYAELMEKSGFSANIITRIKRDNYISLDSDIHFDPPECPHCGNTMDFQGYKNLVSPIFANAINEASASNTKSEMAKGAV